MKIEQIESFLIGGGFVVRLTTDTGLTGIGQTACWGYPTAVQSIVDVYKEYLIGQNPLRIEHHWQHLYHMAPFRGTAIMGAVSAIDIALFDIKGKHFEVPVWELLGGNVRDKIRLHLLSGGGTPEANFKAAKAVADEGVYSSKIRSTPRRLPRHGPGSPHKYGSRNHRSSTRSRWPGSRPHHRIAPEIDADGRFGPSRRFKAFPRSIYRRPHSDRQYFFTSADRRKIPPALRQR